MTRELTVSPCTGCQTRPACSLRGVALCQAPKPGALGFTLPQFDWKTWLLLAGLALLAWKLISRSRTKRRRRAQLERLLG